MVSSAINHLPYPRIETVETADHLQLGRWMRFLPSPGTAHARASNYLELLQRERIVLNRIIERFYELGEWTPELSKQVGWQQPTSTVI